MTDHQCKHERDFGALDAFCNDIKDDILDIKRGNSDIKTLLLGNGKIGIVGRLQAVEAAQTTKARFAVIIPACVVGIMLGVKYFITGSF